MTTRMATRVDRRRSRNGSRLPKPEQEEAFAAVFILLMGGAMLGIITVLSYVREMGL